MDSPEIIQQETSSESLEHAISEQFDALAGAEEIEEVADEPEEQETAETETETNESTEQAEEVTEEPQPEETAELDAQVDAEEPEYDEPPPERWTQEMKEAYLKIPPEARKLMVDGVFKPMQRQYTESTTKIAEMRKQLEPVMDIMEQHSGKFERAGMTPAEAIRRQVAWASHFLDVGVEQGMNDMRASYGLDNGASGQENVAEEYMTPVERQLKIQNDRIEQRLNQQEQQNHQRSAAQQKEFAQAKYMEAQKSLKEFINEQKDGKPAHPYVERVAPQIAGLMKSGLVTQQDEYGQPVPIKAQLAQAYSMACNMDSSIRPAVSTNKQRQVARAKAAQDVSVGTTSPAGHVDVPEKPLTESIEDIWDTLSRKTA